MPLLFVEVAEPFETICEGTMPKAYAYGVHRIWSVW